MSSRLMRGFALASLLVATACVNSDDGAGLDEPNQITVVSDPLPIVASIDDVEVGAIVSVVVGEMLVPVEILGGPNGAAPESLRCGSSEDNPDGEGDGDAGDRCGSSDDNPDGEGEADGTERCGSSDDNPNDGDESDQSERCGSSDDNPDGEGDGDSGARCGSSGDNHDNEDGNDQD